MTAIAPTTAEQCRTQTCEACDGNGWVVGIRAACCGNVTRHGECRGDCAVPEQVQEACDACGGAGEFPSPLRCIDCDAPLLAGEAACCRACEEKHLTAGAAT